MPDVNVLIYAHRAESIEHDRYANWFTELCTSSELRIPSDVDQHSELMSITIPK